jgi:hypothetical protein
MNDVSEIDRSIRSAMNQIEVAKEKYLEGFFGSIEVAQHYADRFTLVEWPIESDGETIRVKWQLMTNEQADALPKHIYPPED